MRTIAENLLEAVSGDDVLSLLLSWRNLVGQQTARISIPVAAHPPVLIVAVPNNMVKQHLSYLKAMIIETINKKQQRQFTTLRFKIKPSLFTQTTERRSIQKQQIRIPEPVHRSKRDAFQRRGISEEMSDIFADIEAILEKKNHTDS